MSAATNDKSPRLVKQTETADIYANGDGTNTAVFYAGPTNFFDKATKKWRKIDNQLLQVGGRIENGAGPVRVQLPSDLSATDGVTVAKDDWSASLTFSDATSKRTAKIKDGKARYDDVAPGISLEYRMLTNGLKEDIVLDQPLPPAHSGRFRFQLSVSGAAPVAVDGGRAVALQDAQGQEVARIPRGTMTDASGADGVVDMRLSQAGGAWLVDVVPDPAFLRSAERTYPIKIDPTLASFGSDTYANSICGSCNYNADPIMKAGRLGTNEYYSYVRFPDVTAIRGKAVTAATLHVVKHYSDDPTNYGLTALRTNDTWDPNTLNWSNKAAHGSETFTWGINQDIYNFPITSWAQGWANGFDAEWIDGNWSPYGATINTAGQDGYYELYSYENGVNRPELWITYTNQSPRVPTSLSPTDGWTGSSAPPLTATLDDPDDSNGWIEFDLDNAHTAIVPTVNGIASFTPFTGGTHTWRARGRDLDSSGPWTALRSLTITAPVEDAELVAYNGDPDSGAPQAPSVLPFSPYSDPQTLSQPDPNAPAAALREGTTTLHQALTGEPSGYLQFPAALTDDQVRDKCRNEPQAAKDKGLVISHTRWCQTKFVRVTVRRGGQPHSWVTWRQTTIGRGNNGERNVTYTVDLDSFRQGGDPQTAQWIYGSPLEISIACNPRWQEITCPSKAGVPMSETHTVGEWKDFVHRTSFELTSPEAGSRPNGDYDDKLAYYQFNLTDKLVGGGFPKGTVNVAQNEFRCDTAPYIYKPFTSELQPGCIFHKVKEVFEVKAGNKLENGEDNPERESARHIYDAQFYPGSTWPYKNDTYGYGPQTDKNIPGSKKSARPLTRNYYDKKLALDNYNHSKKTCEAYDKGYTSRGLECDEYPFKSTYQGSLTSGGHYSVCPITAADNSKVGGRLSGFNGTQRILHAIDQYYVEVVGGSVAHKTGCPSRGEDTFNPPPCAPNCATDPQWNPAAWTTTSNSSSNKVIGTYSGEGELKVTSSSVRATSELAAVADSETSLRYRFSDRNAQSAFQVTLRSSGGSGSDQLTTGYRLEVRSDLPDVKLQKTVNGTVSTLATIPYTQTIDDQWLRFEVQGSTVRARLWPATGVEPSTWLAEVTDTSVTGLGVLQLAHSYTSGGARSVFVDDITVLQTAPDITAPGWDAGHNDVADTLVLPKPAGTAAGSVLVAGVTTRGTPTVTAPTGWTLIRTREEGSSWTLQSYYKIAGASEPIDYTWTLSVAKAAAGTITAYSGVDTTNPIDVSSGQVNSTASTSITAPGVTTTADNAMLVGLFVHTGVADITEPGGMTERGEDASNAPSQAHVAIETADAVQPSAGASGGKTATTTASNTTAAELIALRPAASGGDGASGEITVAGLETGQNNVGTTLVLPKPEGTTAGDVLIAAVAVRGVPTVTAPTGWTLIRSDSNGSSMKTLSYWRVATGSEPANYTWSFSSTRAAAGTITAYTGVNTTNPVDVHSGFANTTDSSQILAPSVTTTGPNERLIGIFSIMKVTGIAPPTGMQELAETSANNGTDPPVTIEIADATQETDGASGDKIATAGTSDRNTGQLIVLRPASSGPA